MKFRYLLAVVGLTACSPASGPPKLRCERPCSERQIVRVDPAFTTDEVKDVWRGLRAWTRASRGSVCFTPQEGDAGFTLAIVRGEDQTWLRPYINSWSGRAAIYKGGTIVIAMNVSRSALDEVVAHEAGHALGLEHASDTASVMYYKTHPITIEKGQLPAVDRDTFIQTRCR